MRKLLPPQTYYPIKPMINCARCDIEKLCCTYLFSLKACIMFNLWDDYLHANNKNFIDEVYGLSTKVFWTCWKPAAFGAIETSPPSLILTYRDDAALIWKNEDTPIRWQTLLRNSQKDIYLYYGKIWKMVWKKIIKDKKY